MSLGPDWIAAAAAVDCLSGPFHGRSRAQQAIALALYENILEARAEWMTSAAGVGRVEEATDEQGLKIPSDIWTRSLHWLEDIAAWDWAESEFRVDVEPWPGDLHVFRGVHFCRKEIEALSPDAPAFASLAPPEPRKAHPRAAAAKYWDWEPALADLVALAAEDGLEHDFGDLTQRGNQAKLERWFADWFRDKSAREEPGSTRDSPSENECRIRAQMVVGSLRTRKANPPH